MKRDNWFLRIAVLWVLVKMLGSATGIPLVEVTINVPPAGMSEAH